ncbi:MAG: zinc-ribbon domain-containing protein [Thermomicrobiales bacterium]|nr:zinc-ribbon domain-containing protein [Thermomicrobiales bacterium]
MKSCPNCGWSNDDDNRFCENCGADFSGLAATGQQPATPASTWSPPPQYGSDQTARAGWDVAPSNPDWRMAPLPAEEIASQRGRRIWLWILGVFLLGCLLFCVGGGYWLGYTDSGKNFQTEVSDRATEEAE